MDLKTLESLAELRIQEREIKAKIDELLPIINEQVREIPQGTELEVAQGRFIVTARRVWEYPAAITEKADEVKKLKKTAEQTGEATYTETTGVLFKEGK